MLLKDEIKHEDDKIICQFSSIGSLGPKESQWLCSEFLTSLISSNISKKLNDNSKIKPICVL